MDLQEGLRASQDRDLATVEARTGVILDLVQALSVTVSEHNVRLGRLERTVKANAEILAEFALDTTARFDQVDRRFDQIDATFRQVDRRFDEQGELLSRMAAKLARLVPDEA
jgi:hypothetical protein